MCTLRDVTGQTMRTISPSRRPVPPSREGPAGYEMPPKPRLNPSGWWFDGLLAAVLVVVTAPLLVDWQPILSIDIGVRDFLAVIRENGPNTIAVWLERLGQGGPLLLLCLVIALVHWWLRRSVEPVIAIVGAFLLSYGSIGTIKVLTDRPMPYKGSVQMFSAPEQMAYPSGHASNSILWYGMLVMLLAPWVWPWALKLLRWFPPIAVGFTTMYLGHHWITDVVGGMIIGVLIERVIRRRLWRQYRVPWLSDKLKLPVEEPVVMLTREVLRRPSLLLAGRAPDHGASSRQ